jgi:hypothetical protein
MRKTHNSSGEKKKGKKLNQYQIFFRKESKREKYEGISAKKRMQLIAKEWERKNKNIHGRLR